MDASPGSQSPHTVGIVGAGTMGRQIALAHLSQGWQVRLIDQDDQAVAAAQAWIQQHAPACADRLAPAGALEELNSCQVLIEAVVENLSVKRRLLAKLSDVSGAALIASNTSSLSIGTLAESIEGPERFCGLHFCHPVQSRRLVEVTAGPQTSAASLRRAEDHVAGLGKLPLHTADVPGFAVNGLLFPYLESAVELAAAGHDWRRIEETAVAWGMPLGPLRQIDGFGIDVVLRAAAAMKRDTTLVPPNSEPLLALYQAGRLGVKSGAGFYRYDAETGEAVIDPAARALVCGGAEPEAQADDLTLRLFLPMLAAAGRLLRQHVVADADAVRLALADGAGATGELFGWAAANRRTIEELRVQG